MRNPINWSCRQFEVIVNCARGIMARRHFLFFQILWSAFVVAMLCWFWNFNARISGSYHTWHFWLDSDPMMFTGFLAVIIGIGYSVLVNRDPIKLIEHLHDSGVIELDKESCRKIKVTLRRKSFLCLSLISSIVLAMMSIGYSVYFDINILELFRIGFLQIFRTDFSQPVRIIYEYDTKYFREFLTASLVCSLAVGLRFGRIAANGFTNSAIQVVKASFVVAIAHPDRAGGLARIGTFCFWQASTLMIPVVWLFSWLVVIIFFDPRREYDGYEYGYSDWQTHFWILQVIPLICFLLGFLLPMLSVRRLMISWKNSNIPPLLSLIKADLHELRRKCRHDSSKISQLRKLTTDLHSLNSLPNWPVSPAMWRGFFSTFGAVITGLVTSLIANFLAP